MVNLELNWLRRYIVRLLTEQTTSELREDANSAAVDAFDEVPKEAEQDAAKEELYEEDEDDIELNDAELDLNKIESDQESSDDDRIEEIPP